MYKFIHDKNELIQFYAVIMPELKEFEVFFTSLSCRKKYLNEEERETFHITRAEMFDRRIIREKDWNRFYRSIKKYEVAHGGYLTKNGKNVPAKCMVIYFNINPSHSLKALKEFNGKINDWQYEIMNGNKEAFHKKFNKLDVELMNCYQRNRGTKHWLDIDFDVPEGFNAPTIMSAFMDSKEGLRYYWVDTKSGFHLLIDRNTLNFNPVDICKRGRQHLVAYLSDENEKIPEISRKKISWSTGTTSVLAGTKNYEIIVNKNAMIPLPGTLQGEYPVRIMWEYAKEL